MTSLNNNYQNVDKPSMINNYSLLLDVVPGPVLGLRFTNISATVLQISWNSPEMTNGVIQLYSVTVETRTDSVFQRNVPGEQRTILVTNLSKPLVQSTEVLTLSAHS